MARSKVATGNLTEENFHKKWTEYSVDCYIIDITFNWFTTELMFSPWKVEMTKTDWTNVEFAWQMVIFNNEKPTYLYKSTQRKNAFRKNDVPWEWMNGRLSSFKRDEDTYITMFSIQFDPIPSESKIKSWKYTISRNDEVYDEYMRHKNWEKSIETTVDEDVPF